MNLFSSAPQVHPEGAPAPQLDGKTLSFRDVFVNDEGDTALDEPLAAETNIKPQVSQSLQVHTIAEISREPIILPETASFQSLQHHFLHILNNSPQPQQRSSSWKASSIQIDPSVIPKIGVSLKFLDEFISACGGRDSIADLTTTDVGEQLVKPFTSIRQMSMCALLQQSGHTGVDSSTVFVSHTGKDKFVDLVDTLRSHFRESNDTVVWLDIFSMNHHATFDKTVSWMLGSFQDNIKQIGYSVVILHDAHTLTKSWTLWDIYMTVKTKAKLDILITLNSHSTLLENIDKDCNAVLSRLKSMIDVARSDCGNEADKELILSSIVANNDAFSDVNAIAFKAIQMWALTEVQVFTAKRIQSSNTIPTLSKLARVYQDQAMYKKAQPLYSQCYEICKALYGLHNRETVAAMNNLANNYAEQGLLEKAQPLYEQCYETNKLIMGEKHAITLAAMNNLAAIYGRQGVYDKALPLYEQCYNLRKASLGENHAETITSMNHLAAVYCDNSKFDLAQPLYEQIYLLHSKHLGRDHKTTIAAMEHLAGLYRDRGMFSKAEPMYREVIAAKKVVLGDSHLDTLTTMNTLANLFCRQPSNDPAVTQKNYESARSLYEQCYEVSAAAFGERHTYTLFAMNNLAVVLCCQHRLDIAQPWHEDCYELRRQVLGETHMDTLTSLHNLVTLYRDRNMIELALPLAERCYRLRKTTLGERHVSTLASLHSLAMLTSDSPPSEKDQVDNKAKAIQLLKDCYEARRAVLGDRHPDTMKTKQCLDGLGGSNSSNKVSTGSDCVIC